MPRNSTVFLFLSQSAMKKSPSFECHQVLTLFCFSLKISLKYTPANTKNGKFDPIIRTFPDNAPAKKKMNTTTDNKTTPSTFTHRFGLFTTTEYKSANIPRIQDKITGCRAVFQASPWTKTNS